MKKIYAFITLLVFTYTVNAQTINTSAIPSSTYCQNETINISYTITGTYNPGNTFTAQLSDASGSFSSPTNIGTLVSSNLGTITATLPSLLLSGTQYRIRVISDNPAIIGANNGTDLTIQGNPTNPSTFGNNIWNAYCYNINSYTNNTSAFDYSDYKGMYTQSGESFSSSDLWTVNSNPSTAAGYTGCSVNNDRHIVQYKRKGFPCNYYTLSIAGPGNSSGHDDAARLVIDGNVVWSNSGCCAPRPDVWSGFLGPNSEVEFTWSDNGGQSYGRMTFEVGDYPTVSPDVTICAGTSTTLTASGALNYDWSLNSTHLVAPLNTNSVVVSPAGGTPNSIETYTVSSYDALTTCTASNTINVTINSLPSTSVTPTTSSYCASGNVDVTASGANTYSWYPATGVTINSPSGHTATLSPLSTTTYTVVGSNNCANDSDYVTINVNTPSGNPNAFGNYSWDVYCYDGNNFNTYMGMYTHNTVNFDTRSLWGNNNSPSSAPGYIGCPIPNDNHSFRYKRKGFDCGYYQLDIPNHDDNVNLIINGVSVFSQNSWFGNTYKANVWQGYLDADSEIEYTIREFSGGSNGGLTFIYLFGPNNSVTETVWNGKVSNDWANSNNWCNGVPNSSTNSYIPYNVPNTPQINAVGSSTKSLYIQTGASLTINGTNDIEVYGNITKNGNIIPNNSTFKLMGTDSIILSSSNTNLVFSNLEINNSSAIICSSLHNNTITINTNLNLLNGNIYTGTNNTVRFIDNATATGMNSLSFIDGNVSKIGNDIFTFPVGNSGYYNPIGISAPSLLTDEFKAKYTRTTPNNRSNLDASLNHVSSLDLWDLERVNGTSSLFVTLYWNSADHGVTSLADLAVTHYDSGTNEWENMGGIVAGSTSSGSILSTVLFTTFSPITLASKNGINPLPIKLFSFNASAKDNHVELKWITSSEINNDFFTIERSNNGIIWEEVNRIKGAGNSNTNLQYDDIDKNPLNGVSYYRLKQTDFNGDFSYSDIVTVAFSTSDIITIYPNPVKENLFISNLCEDCIVKVYSSFGKLIYSGSEQKINTQSWKNGIYQVVINNNGTIQSKTIIK
jgi:hypothetical protein